MRGVPVHGSGNGRRGTLLLRPERLRLSRTATDPMPSLPVRVDDMTFLGSNVHVSAVTAWGEAVAVRLPFGHEAISGLARGDTVWLGFDPENVHVFR